MLSSFMNEIRRKQPVTPEDLLAREIARLRVAAAEADPMTALDSDAVLAALQAPRSATTLDVLRSLVAPLVAAGQMDPEAAGAALHELARRDHARKAMAVAVARRR